MKWTESKNEPAHISNERLSETFVTVWKRMYIRVLFNENRLQTGIHFGMEGPRWMSIIKEKDN